MNPRLTGVAMLLVTAASWGLNWPVLKFIIGEWPPFFFRIVTGATGVALLLTIASVRGERILPPRGQWLRLSVAGVLNITAWTTCATLSLFWLAASEAAIIAYTMPVWANLFAWPVLGERPTTPRVAGLVLGFGGVAVLLGGQLASAPASDLVAKLPGVFAILGTATMFAGGAVVTKRWPVTMPALPLVAWQIIIGTIPTALISIGFEHWSLSRVTLGGWGAMLYVGVVALCISYLAWFRALKLLPASTAAIGTLLVPVIGVLSSGLFLGEPLGLRQLSALALTVAGVAVASRGSGRQGVLFWKKEPKNFSSFDIGTMGRTGLPVRLRRVF